MKDARWYVDQLLMRQSANKDLGQHFLVDDDILQHIVEAGDVQENDHVLEIGPGPGTLTTHLLRTGCRVTSVEIDQGACQHLHVVFGDELASGQLELIEGDALQTKLPRSITKVVANIPYQISSPLIEVLTRFQHEHNRPLTTMVLMVQEEFAERLEMKYTDTVGSLGLVVSLDFDVEMMDKVSPDAFIPHPKVHSRVVKFIPRQPDLSCNRKLLVMAIHHCFDQRRKKLRTLFKNPPKRISRVRGWYAGRWKEAYQSMKDIPLMEKRPEELDLEEWVQLVSSFEQHGS